MSASGATVGGGLWRHGALTNLNDVQGWGLGGEVRGVNLYEPPSTP